MARERVISRTIFATSATVRGLNTETGEAETRKVCYTGQHDEKGILKEAKKEFATSSFVPVLVQDINTSEHLFVLSEDVFAHTVRERGKILPPRGTAYKAEDAIE